MKVKKTKDLGGGHLVEVGSSTWDEYQTSIRNRYPTSKGGFSPRSSSEIPLDDVFEAIYNPLFGIPIWIAWVKNNNKARFGDEATFKQEAIEAQARRAVAKERSRKLATKMVTANAALAAYEKLSPKQRENTIQAGLHLGALAALNPDKAKQVKSAISNLGKQGAPSNALERVKELNELYENQLISKKEYDSKKAEILSHL